MNHQQIDIRRNTAMIRRFCDDAPVSYETTAADLEASKDKSRATHADEALPSAPARIWLQHDPDNIADGFPPADCWEHVTWSASKINDSDVEYRRAAPADDLRAALEWYGEQARLCRLIHSEGDAGRNALAADGGKRARAALSQKGGAA